MRWTVKNAVSDPAHLRAEDLDLRVEGFGTAPDVIEKSIHNLLQMLFYYKKLFLFQIDVLL